MKRAVQALSMLLLLNNSAVLHGKDSDDGAGVVVEINDNAQPASIPLLAQKEMSEIRRVEIARRNHWLAQEEMSAVQRLRNRCWNICRIGLWCFDDEDSELYEGDNHWARSSEVFVCCGGCNPSPDDIRVGCIICTGLGCLCLFPFALSMIP